MKYLFGLLFFIGMSGHAQDIVYLKFEEGKESKCQLSSFRDGRNKKEYSYKPYKGKITDKKIGFLVCGEHFVYDPSLHGITYELPENIEYITIDEMFTKLETPEYRFAKEKVYKKIFIVEVLPNNKVNIYPVTWSKIYYWEDVEYQKH
ncbi:hypothetical protein [Aurantibacter sp.]|uniref:hypothetical protein n=1 Tax=Aurantibacter sp. TaxID=2807103 RepID=UPI0035C82857